tara:strand:- start:261 stop:473 length:213 start_codon:yes stop_codon:yes gene_type:complete
MMTEMSREERWVHIAKLEADNRASNDKSEARKRAREREMKRINDISNVVGVAMSIFTPALLVVLTPRGKI